MSGKIKMKVKNIEIIRAILPFLLIFLAGVIGLSVNIDLFTLWKLQPVEAKSLEIHSSDNHSLLTNRGDR